MEGVPRGIRWELVEMDTAKYNANHHSVKRILREVKESLSRSDGDITATPLDVSVG